MTHRRADPVPRGAGGRRGRPMSSADTPAAATVDADAERPAPQVFSVVSSERMFDGVVASVRVDEVVMPGGGTAKREVVEHGGAVAIVALDTAGPLDQAADFDVVDAEDSADMVILIEQYRHPLGRRLWELPAGLMDVEGEPGQAAAARELIEETGYAAEHWSVLLDVATSPGFTEETVRIFLATGSDRGRPTGQRTRGGGPAGRPGAAVRRRRVGAGRPDRQRDGGRRHPRGRRRAARQRGHRRPVRRIAVRPGSPVDRLHRAGSAGRPAIGRIRAAVTSGPVTSEPVTSEPLTAEPVLPEPSAELSSALRGYLDHLAVERGVARNTLLSYRRDLRRYLIFLASSGRTRVDEITSADVSEFLATLRTGTDGHPAAGRVVRRPGGGRRPGMAPLPAGRGHGQR